jgi:hypothetical protein
MTRTRNGRYTPKASSMDPLGLNWILEQSGLALFAALALFLMWYQYKENIRKERENAEIHIQDKNRIANVLEDVARSNTQLCHLIRELRDDLREQRMAEHS